MIFGQLILNLVYAAMLVVFALVLKGAVDSVHLLELVLLFVLIRGTWLVVQALKPLPTEAALAAEAENLAYCMLPPGASDNAAELPQALEAVRQSASYQLTLQRVREQTRPRDRREIICEIASLILVLPASILIGLMLSSNLVSFTGMARGTAAGSVATGFAVYFLPSLIPVAKSFLRIQARLVLSVLVLGFTFWLASNRHPYLLKFGAPRRQLVAQRVLELGPTVEAYRHADKLFAYADDLAESGQVAEAAVLYERGLQGDPHNNDAHRHLASLYALLGKSDQAEAQAKAAEWTPPKPGELRVPHSKVQPLPVLPTNVSANTFIICLVPFGDVPPDLLDWAGQELHARSNLPVFRFDRSFPLPAADRQNGLAGGGQWNAETLLNWFFKNGGPFTRGPVQYIVVCSADLYTGESNFVFGISGRGHGLISFARFHNKPADEYADDALLVDRLAKQLYSASIKGLGVPASTDPNCVTTYPHNLAEFDQKSPVPSPITAKLYQAAIQDFSANALRQSPAQ